MRLLVLPLVTLALVGCGQPQPDPAAGPAQGVSRRLGTDVKDDACPSPVRWAADPGAAHAVEAAARALFPGAAVTTRAGVGTLATVSGARAELGACAPLGSVAGPVLAFLDAHPEVFRLRSAEWLFESAPACGQLPAAGDWYRLTRAEAGAAGPTGNQTLALRLEPGRRGPVLRAVFASYLPAAPAPEAALATCQGRPDVELEAAVLSASYPFTTFFRCVQTGSGKYEPRGKDQVELGGKPAWHFFEDAGGAALWLLRPASLRVAAANVTQELLDSDAACSPSNVGFGATVDALSGQVLGTRPGLGCVVCAAP